MRIARICDSDQANAFLPGFTKRYNQRFAALPLDPNSAFRPAPASEQLDQILAFKERRTANNGSVISFEGLLYQLVEASGRVAPLPARSRIDVVRSLDGSLFAIHDQKRYSLTRLVPALPEKPATPKPVSTEQHKPRNTKRGKPFLFIKKPRVLLPNHAGRTWLGKS